MSISEALFERAKKLIPGGVNSPVRSFKHVGTAPVYFAKGEGAYLIDVEGNRYIDFCLAFGPHLLGHGSKPLVSALHAQVDKATTFGACHPKEIELAEWAIRAYPFLDQVRMVNSGTEAVMTAVRLARGATGRSKIVQFEGCYHGHSDGFLAKAGSGLADLSESTSRGVPASIVAETLVARLDDLEGLQRLFETHPGQIACVLLEPMPANNGLWLPSKAHLETVIRMARENGALVIFDEVISGFRVGLSGVCGLYDLAPDLVTLGKILGGGLPAAAVLGKRAVMELLAPVGGVYQAGTLSGNPMATAAGCAVMETLFANPPYAVLESRTAAFVERLRTVLSGVAEVRTVASLFWIHFGAIDSAFPPEISSASRSAYSAFFRKALKEGIYLPPSPYEVAFLSTEHTDSVLDSALEKIERCVA
jgi:glutamate-1-semialdehyde 2,1-aminomutase